VTPILKKKTKTTNFFICSHLKLLKGFLSMNLKPPSQDQKARNNSLPSKSSKPPSIPKNKTTIANPA
jgi:hypothetical protein